MKTSLLEGYNTDDSIAALASPWASGALALIRTSGKTCARLLAPAFSRPEKLLAAPGGTFLHGFIRDPAVDETLDEVVVSVFRSPASYTGEDSVEISCHGSLAGIQRILALLCRLGFRSASPGEFTFRAFCNGRMDLTRAEAVREIIAAETDKAHSLALARLGGGLEKKITGAKTLVAQALAEIEIRLDYDEADSPEGEVSCEGLGRAEDIIGRLLATYAEGRLYQEGAALAIAGRTNAGKSSLFNAFLKEERAIVSGFPGTTRDYLEARVSIAGIPLRLYDTAGLRDSHEPVEIEGVRRSRLILENASLVLYVIDAAEGPSDEDRENISFLGERVLLVWNKCDSFPRGFEAGSFHGNPAPGVRISALTGEGIPELYAAVEKKLLPRSSSREEEVLIDSERQKALLEKSLAALERFRSRWGRFPLDALAADVREALTALGEITGEVTTEDVLGIMFSRFCVGK